MPTKMLMNWTGVQSVILHAIEKPGGATWKEIKAAIEEEGWIPKDWLTQVRGPLQNLIDSRIVERVNSDIESERYVISTSE